MTGILTEVKLMTELQKVQKWLAEEQWYQKIELSNGLFTGGKISVCNRFKYFKDIDFKDKSFLDIGCNSGGYCLWAKKNGASKVVGIDIATKRIRQAQRLKEIENLDITFLEKNLFDLNIDEQYDIIFCISVLTEITDFFGALTIIKSLIKDIAFIELRLARPVIYLSKSPRWRNGYKTVKRRKAVMELHESKRGYMTAPSLEIIKSFFGSNFEIIELGRGERYDLIKITKLD